MIVLAVVISSIAIIAAIISACIWRADMQRMKQDGTQMQRILGPMMAYLDTLQPGQVYDETAFRQFLREQYGQEYLDQYLMELYMAHAMIRRRNQ